MSTPNDKRVISRRALLEGAAAACAVTVAAPFINRGRYRLFAYSEAEYSARAIALVQRSTIVDMLCILNMNFAQADKWMANPETFTDKDFQRWRDSGINAIHPAVGLGGVNAYESGLTFFAQWNSFIAGSTQYFDRIDTAGDFKRIKGSGKVGVILGLQNAQHFRRPDDVNAFHALGQRVSQLTYNSRNLIGNGSTERRDEGISDFGVAIVERMNQVGMAVDVSHCGDRTTLDAFEIS